MIEPKQLCRTCGQKKYALAFVGKKCEDCATPVKVPLKQIGLAAQMAITAAGRHAKHYGLPFDLNDHRDDIDARFTAARCEVTSMRLDLTANDRAWNAPRLRRVNAKKGWVASNVQVVSHALDSALGTWGPKKLIEIADALQRGA